MAVPTVPTRLMPSLIDRLTDPECMGGAVAGYDLKKTIDSVRIDLEDLLNTRRTFDPALVKPFAETAKSIAAYGLPDLNNYNGTSRDQCTELGKAITNIINRYEPRLRKVRVKIVTGKEHGSIAVRFHIDAELNVDPSPEIGFETVLELTTGKASVQTTGGERMSQELYPYYERELLAIRNLAQDFAKQYPAAAGRLMLEPSRSTDPHVERMIEAFALLAGRVHHKLDDDFPELTDALLHVLYPHYLAPIPSMAVMQFVADAARTPLLTGFKIPRHSKLFTAAVDDVPCRYRTAYDITLWPLSLAAARLQPPPFPAGLQPPVGSAAFLRLSLKCEAGATFAKLAIQDLRLHLVGENHIVADLYELLLNGVIRAEAVNPDSPTQVVPLPGPVFEAVGFEESESLLPYPPQSFPGYRLVSEFFAYPAKFWFLNLKHLDRIAKAGFGGRADIVFYLKRSTPNLEAAVTAGTFRLYCTPVVNLFDRTAEPIPLTMAQSEYPVVPEFAHPTGYEVYSVDEVAGVDPTQNINIDYRPFYSVTHALGRDAAEAFWYPTRRPATRENDRGSDVYLQMVDRNWSPTQPAVSTLVIRTTCTNRNLAGALARAGDRLQMTLEMAAPISEVKCVRTPTPPLRPPRRKGAHWRLLSHLSLNHLSIGEGTEALQSLQEILRLYDFSDPAFGAQLADINRLLIEGVVGLKSRRVVGRVDDPVASGFCRGTEITVHLDDEKYVGTGTFLFASLLERFFALYASINSFTQLVAKSRDGKSVIHAWPPRAGTKPLI